MTVAEFVMTYIVPAPIKPKNAPSVCKANYDARQRFIDLGLDYSVVREDTLDELALIIDKVLCDPARRFDLAMITHTYRGGKHYQIQKEHDRTVCAEITLDSRYFKQREGVTFNSDGWIGFAGWACTENSKLITDAFLEWCDWLEHEVC